MFRSLSKSTSIMFLFDFVVFAMLTYSFCELFIGNSLDVIIKIFSAALVVIAGLFSLYLKGQYKIREHNLTVWNAYRLLEGVVFANIPLSILLFFFVSKLVLVKLLGLNILVIFVTLALYRVCFHYYLFNIKRIKNILIIGTNENAKVIADEIVNKKALKMKVIGFVEDIQENETLILDRNEKIFNQPWDIARIVKENNIDTVIVAIKRRMEEQFLTDMVFGIPRNIKVYKMPEFYEMITGKYYIDEMSINWLFYDFMRNRSPIYDFCKRAFDIIAASIVLVVTLPVLIYIAVRVKHTDSGNPIYTQTRIGMSGKPFECLKLRTMYKNDYVPKQGQIKADTAGVNDDRVIPFCRFVRKSRLDEVPQMINILRGDMSIVGPRTEWEDLVKIYSKEVSYYPCRMWTKTGWTGWAQINQGHCVSTEDITEKLQYDLYYLKHRNLLWEIGILVKAVFLALGGRHE